MRLPSKRARGRCGLVCLLAAPQAVAWPTRSIEFAFADEVVPPEAPSFAPPVIRSLPVWPASTRGGLYPAAGIRAVVRADLDGLRACVPIGRAGAPALRVQVRFRIDGLGKARDIRVSADALSSLARRCIADTVQTWQFAATRDRVIVHYPFVL